MLHCVYNVLMIGPPGSGKTMLAKRIPTIMPDLTLQEALRQPLEDGFIRISRVIKSFTFPASFMLVCAMNPCPCGYYTDPRKACRCNPNKIASYMGKISGPLLDRIDIHIELPSIKYKELTDTKDAEPSATIKTRIEKARTIQRERFKSEGIYYNAQMNTKLIRKYCVLENEAGELLRMAMTELGLSARAYDKILKVSRTIGDLAQSEWIRAEHISEAIQYRSLDRHLC